MLASAAHPLTITLTASRATDAGKRSASTHDHTDRRYLSEDSMSLLYPERDSLTTAELTAGNQPPRLNPKAHHSVGHCLTTSRETPPPRAGTPAGAVC